MSTTIRLHYFHTHHSLPIYPFTPPIQERLFQELSAATALSSPLKVQIQYSASAIHSASLIRAVVERCHHSNTRNIADNTKTAWLEEPVSDTVAFLCSLGMFHPLSAQRLLSRVDSLTALLAMEWDEMYVAAHDCMPEHSLRAFYQWTTAAPRE